MHNRQYKGTYRPGRVCFIQRAEVMRIDEEYLCHVLYRDFSTSRPKKYLKLHVLNQDMTGFKDTNLTFCNLSHLVADIRGGSLLKYEQKGAEYLGIYRPGRSGFETFIEKADIYLDDKGRIYLKSKYRRHSPATYWYGLFGCNNRLLRFDPEENTYKDRGLRIMVYNTDIPDVVRGIIAAGKNNT